MTYEAEELVRRLFLEDDLESNLAGLIEKEELDLLATTEEECGRLVVEFANQIVAESLHANPEA